MAKRGLSNSEDQTKSAKSAKSAKKKAEGAETARDAAPGSRVYTVEYQVDTEIDEFDEEGIIDEEDYAETLELAMEKERQEHEVHEASQHLDVVYGSMASAKAAAKETVIRLCKEYWKLHAKTDKELNGVDNEDDDDMERRASSCIDEYKEGNWTRLYSYFGWWNLKLKRDKKEPDLPEHTMSAAICVGVGELEVVE
jgi:hypothetical protein